MESQYNSVLSLLSKRFCRFHGDCEHSNFYYESIRLNISQNGLYIIRSNANINTYGYIYKDSFDSLNPEKNILQENDNGSGSNQFSFDITLDTLNTYILVITAYEENTFGPFSILAFGPGPVRFIIQ